MFRNAGATPIATVTVTNYTDTNLVASTTYSYSVVAFDAATPANVSAASAAVNATTNAAPPPGAGSGLDARPANATCLAGGDTVLDDDSPTREAVSESHESGLDRSR